MQCRLCGFEFKVSGLACHTGCPMGSGCHLICCPNCGYQVVDESRSRIAKALDRLFKKPHPDAPARSRRVLEEQLIPLSHASQGEDVAVRRIDPMPASRLSRLAAFGLAPGASVRVLQRTPVPVIRVGETEIGLGIEILDQIWVDGPDAS